MIVNVGHDVILHTFKYFIMFLTWLQSKFFSWLVERPVCRTRRRKVLWVS